MTPIGRDVHMVAGSKPQRFRITLEFEDGGALEEQDPLAIVLIVPE